MWLLWLTVAIILVAALFGAGTWAAHDPWALVELRKLPRSTVATASGDETIRLVGVVRAPSGEPYVVRHTITEERQRHGRHLPGVAETTWVRTEVEVDARDFWIEDETGRALVVADGELVRLMLVQGRYAPTSDFGDRRSFEACIVDGDRIAVCGHATWEPGDGSRIVLPTDDMPEIAGRQLVIRARERDPIVISDEANLLA